MRKIAHYVEMIDEEIESAKEYAESYLECKAKGNTSRSQKYREMANDELKHTILIHDIASEDIAELEKVYTPPVEMQNMWDESHKMYVEKVAWIKQMLAM